MIAPSIEADTLDEYYEKLYNLQSIAHKPEYMLVHDEIKTRLAECDSYTEFGVNQGTTLATAILQNPSTIRAYDINLHRYDKAHALFKQYADDHYIDYDVIEDDTLNCTIASVDLLYIDTLHYYTHLTKELALHGSKVNKFIIFHDTFAQPGLRKAVEEYVTENKKWTIVTDCKVNVGFMTIAKK